MVDHCHTDYRVDQAQSMTVIGSQGCILGTMVMCTLEMALSIICDLLCLCLRMKYSLCFANRNLSFCQLCELFSSLARFRLNFEVNSYYYIQYTFFHLNCIQQYLTQQYDIIKWILQYIFTIMRQIHKYITLQNVSTNSIIKHQLDNSECQLNILTYRELIDIIELYQPTSDLNKILIQAKSQQPFWQYITQTFSLDLRYDSEQLCHFRYRLAQPPKISSTLTQKIVKNLQDCQQKLKKYQSRFDINSMDINIFWSSPLYNKGKSECKWQVWCQGYIREIGNTLKRSNKKVHITLNTFNANSFKARDEYSIVYLICHTECLYKNGKQSTKRQQYFYGEQSNGEMVMITPVILAGMLKNKKIQLLILHTSYPYFHLDSILRQKGIQNVLLINCNPIYQSQSPRYFLRYFLKGLLSNQSMKVAHEQAVKEVLNRFPGEETCCCYHTHDQDCPSVQIQQYNYRRFTTSHNINHKLKKDKVCCCPSSKKQGFDYNLKHDLKLTFDFTKKDEGSFNKAIFDFEKGELKGDEVYFKGFQTRQGLLGNNKILRQMIKVFHKPSNMIKDKNVYKMFNIYDKISGDKQIFVTNLANVLIRKKIFIENRLYDLKDFEAAQIKKNPLILHTIFCEAPHLQKLKRLQSNEVNILLVSNSRLPLQTLNPSYSSSKIQPLQKEECWHYIRAQKHLNQSLKDNVPQFIKVTWAKEYSHIYYPINFDYDWIMSVVAQNKYEDQTAKQYVKLINEKLIPKQGYFQQFVLFMSIFIKVKEKKLLLKEIRNLGIYQSIYGKTKQDDDIYKLIDYHCKHFPMIFPYFFRQIQKFSLKLMKCMIKLCYPSLKQGVAPYQATTDSSMSLISMCFKKIRKECLQVKINQKLEQLFIKSIDFQVRLESALALVQNIISSFYLYDVLQQIQQKLQRTRSDKSKSKSKQRYKQDKEMNLMREYSQQKDQQTKSVASSTKIEHPPERKKQLKEPQIINGANNQQAKPSNDRKSQMLILCLLVINCAVIYRKNNSKYKQKILNNQEKQHTINQQQEKRISNINKLPSDKISLKSKESKNKKREFSWKDDEDQDNQHQQNLKRYTQIDFISKPQYLSRLKLQDLINKIRKKKPDPKIVAICHGLNMQLIVQVCYKSESQFENYQSEALNNSINSLITIVKNWGSEEELAKARIIYDIFMARIIQMTRAGRNQINLQYFNDLQQQIKSIGELESKFLDRYKDKFVQQNLQLLESMCSVITFKQVKPLIFKILANLRKKQFEQTFIEQYLQTVKMWQQFNEETLQLQKQTSATYLKIFNMKNKIEEFKQDKKNISRIGVYVLRMINDLENMLQRKLKQLSASLMVVFICKAEEVDQKFIIDYDSILTRDTSAYDKTYSESYNQRSQSQTLQEKKNFIQILLPLNRKNIELVAKRGCRYLLISANTCTDLLIAINLISKNEKSPSYKLYVEAVQILLKIKCAYIFLCILKDANLNKTISNRLKQSSKNITVLGFNFKNLQVKPEDEFKMAYMIVISMMIASQAHEFDDFSKAVNLIRQNLHISYGKYHAEMNIYVQNQRGLPYVLCKKFEPRQIKSILVFYYGSQILGQEMIEQDQNSRKIDKNISLQSIISEMYLKQIKILLDISKIKKQKKHLNKVQRNIENCLLDIFIPNFKFYLRKKYDFPVMNIFELEDSGIPQSPTTPHSKQSGEYQSVLLHKMLIENKQFIRAYFSNQVMAVIIKNFKYNRALVWETAMLRELFLDHSATHFQTKFVKIQNVQCLFCIRFEGKKVQNL